MSNNNARAWKTVTSLAYVALCAATATIQEPLSSINRPRYDRTVEVLERAKVAVLSGSPTDHASRVDIYIALHAVINNDGYGDAYPKCVAQYALDALDSVGGDWASLYN